MLRQTAQIPIAALYARLSRDDELQGESNSIMNHANAVQGEDLRIKRKHRKHESAQARPASFLLGGYMATTRIIPMHLNKGKTLAQCLADRTEYGMNPDKTDSGELISSFACEPETVVSEFALSKRE